MAKKMKRMIPARIKKIADEVEIPQAVLPEESITPFVLPSTGSISMSQVNNELGVSPTASVSLNQSNVRTLAGKSSGAISMGDLRGKKHRTDYFLLGSAVTEQYGYSYDSGTSTQVWNNIPSNTRIRSRVWASNIGSASNNGPNGYVKITWIIKNLSGTTLLSSTRIDKNTSGDGAGGIGQWAEAKYINELVSTSENVHVEIQMRFIAGDYYGHIGGGRSQVRRILGIESQVGY